MVPPRLGTPLDRQTDTVSAAAAAAACDSCPSAALAPSHFAHLAALSHRSAFGRLRPATDDTTRQTTRSLANTTREQQQNSRVATVTAARLLLDFI